ncbi:hypothetical protein DM01DRAFT_1381170 [Hesseltinella vesiculosa]|uniref:NET domain-containing protein n=1 Tax=Hesseltinella vesiculosa TaxID=101127 RepID=A0A1X2GRJ2_9FUNG|nr:hypothetical protein DM01DRAFT_1381170 [Hesseltinella vesiculosa]
MTGSTVLAQSSNVFNNYNVNSNNPTMEDNDINDLMQSLPNPSTWPVEDLTNEVQDLLLRESMASWLPWLPTDQSDTMSPLPKETFDQLDPDLLTQSLQLLGQDMAFPLDDSTNTSLFYDELTFDSLPSTEDHPSLIHSPSEISTISGVALLPTANEDLEIADDALRIDADALAEDDEEEEEDEEDEGSSDDEAEYADPLTSSYMYHPKRQLEEALLAKITQQLTPEKLPGILSIVNARGDHAQQEEEVELDLSSLEREQLVRIMLYVDACVAEQHGGKPVVLADFIPKHAAANAIHADEESAMMLDGLDDKDRRRQRRRKQQLKRKAKSKFNDEAHHVSTADAAITNLLPVLPSTTKKPRNKKPPRPRQPRARKKTQDTNKKPTSKRRNGLHKRRLLEDTLLLASDEDDQDEATQNNVLIVYSDEQMDFGVVDNQTIAHQPSATPSAATSPNLMHEDMDVDEDDEEIDIM